MGADKEELMVSDEVLSKAVMAKRLKLVQGQMADDIAKYGFHTHYVSAVVGGNENNDLLKGFVNAHTHGFEQSVDHLNFQLVIALRAEMAHGFFWEFMNWIKAGRRFKDGDVVEKLLKGFPVRLAETTECGRPVLRIIFPDKNGKFPGDKGVDKKYGRQEKAEVD